ncbi:3-oxoacyl-[acyl-carrier protein] reductase [Labilithrix luteola]|uniref:3-oxoacyl-[acyl-carrier protein] reductase n=1 Tax=Labilithrix luteola TaxID=1391654 RepID=A0A0K1PQ90_9BACT|nr:3-oxoacyl-ACP reductase FabG [Labilithrix luteola]AKU95698.1 3-oxoacyl-[acyl-carrier protein] reductase [Labilithrix luteola]
MTSTTMHEAHRRVAVVTGAAAGIGQAYALRLAADGHAVAIADLGPAEQTVRLIEDAGGAAFAVPTDVADPDSVARFARAVADRFGGADILVHNAGIYPVVAFEETDWSTWRKVMGVNLDSAFHLTHAFLPGMKAKGWGRIVLVASTAFHTGPPGLVAYAASKGGVIGFARSLAAEIGEFGVTVNVIAPGMVRTPGTLAGRQHELGLFDKVLAAQAIKRTGTPEDLMSAVSFLTSDGASFVTGQTLAVDGGVARL